MIRTRSAGPLDEKPSAPALQKKPLRTTQLVSSVKTKAAAASRSSSTSASRKPVLKKQTVIVKRYVEIKLNENLGPTLVM